MNPLLERIRIAKQETKDFPYKIGDEEFIITVRKFKPGTAMRLRKTGLIKLHRVVKAEAVPFEEITDEEFAEQLSAQGDREKDLNQDFVKAVVDKESGENYVSIEDAVELFDNDFKYECVSYAMGGAAPPDENPSEEEEFPPVSSEPGE